MEDWAYWSRVRPRFDRIARLQSKRWHCLHLRHVFVDTTGFFAIVNSDPTILRCRAVQRRILERSYFYLAPTGGGNQCNVHQ